MSTILRSPPGSRNQEELPEIDRNRAALETLINGAAKDKGSRITRDEAWEISQKNGANNRALLNYRETCTLWKKVQRPEGRGRPKKAQK